MKQRTIITIALIHFLFSARGQTNQAIIGAYQVDSKVKEQIEQKVKTFNGVTMGSIDFKMYKNDSLIADTDTKGKSIECMTMTTLDGDTANITGFMGMFAGFGFQIALFGDTCIVRHFAKSDVEIYKLNKTDSLTFGISVPCKSYQLTLANKPAMKKGDIIEGVVKLSSEEYYEVSNGDESKYRIELVGYFKTEPLQSLDDKLKKLEDQLKNYGGEK
jgi:hypothetical protein